MKSLVIANWKMNPATLKQAKTLFDATKLATEWAKSVTVVVAPPAIYLHELKTRYKGRRIAFAGQDAHFEASGAQTGEISLQQFKDAGASYVIVGHSEQRALGKTNDDTRKTVAAAIALGITPVLCVGEKARSASGEHFAFIKEELQTGFADVAPEKLGKVIVAYEPVWAIGGEKTMSPRDMHEMAIFIRKTIVGAKGEAGMKIKILYGGSANESNTRPMLDGGDVDGLLVGHVSIDPARFTALIRSIIG